MKALNPVEFLRSLRGVIDGKIDIPQSLKDNQVLQVLLNRRSMRSFQQRDIPDDVFTAVLEAARVAPNAINSQSWSFGIYDQLKWKETFGSSMPFKANRGVIILGDMNRVRQAIDEFPYKPLVEYTLCVMNASIAAYAMNIAAEACGVASVMLSDTGRSGFYDACYLKEKLDFPEGVFPVMTIVFGYPKGKALGMPPKLPLEEIVFTGKYKQPDKTVMKRWLQQMMAAYRAAFVTRSLQGQMQHYLSKVDNAEKGLRDLIFYRPEESAKLDK